jgi:hypothetical protein
VAAEDDPCTMLQHLWNRLVHLLIFGSALRTFSNHLNGQPQILPRSMQFFSMSDSQLSYSCVGGKLFEPFLEFPVLTFYNPP